MGKTKKVKRLLPLPGKSKKKSRHCVSSYHQHVHTNGASKVTVSHLDYQLASQASLREHSTNKWAVKVLSRLFSPSSRPKLRLELLEIGCVDTHFNKVSWIQNRGIDLRSTHPSIEALDFFDLPISDKFDVVVCSMVINFILSPLKRGEMLHKVSRDHLREGGLFFLVFPKRTMLPPSPSKETFVRLLREKCSLHLVFERESPKLLFFVLFKGSSEAVQGLGLPLFPAPVTTATALPSLEIPFPLPMKEKEGSEEEKEEKEEKEGATSSSSSASTATTDRWIQL